MGKPVPWPKIVSFYREKPINPDEPFWQAFQAVGGLASYIEDSALRSILFGWTSMHDLGIQQTDGEVLRYPHLRVSPQLDGTVEFRYHDTMVKARQWSRNVAADGVVERFDAFLDQLRWVAR